jgi:hypothetical protein
MTHLAVPARSIPDSDFPGGWTLYRLPESAASSFLWREFKLMQPPGTPARWGEQRAYSLAWGFLEQRLRRDRGSQALAARGELYALVELHMSLNYGPAWLQSEDGGGYTADEITAERMRLSTARAERKAKRRGARTPAA